MGAPRKLQLQPHFNPVVCPGQGVLLLLENGSRVLRGVLYERLIPLLDGTRTADQIVQALAPDFTEAEIYFSLISLQSRNYLCESLSSLKPTEAAFWADLGLDPEQAISLIRASRVALQAVSLAKDHPSLQTMRQALSDIGLSVVNAPCAADLTVVLCDEYLASELELLNQRFRQEGRRWLLVRPHGRELWLGPLFDPKLPGCFACLSRLLIRHRQVEQFAAAAQGLSIDQISKFFRAPGAAALISHWTALEVARVLADASPQTGGHVISFNVANYHSERHTLLVDPHCPICGRPEEPRFKPLELQPCPVRFDQDGGHRCVSAEETLKRFSGLISPISGIVKELRPVPSSLSSANVVLAGYNPVQKLESINDLRRNLRTDNAGKGMSMEQAQASALGEALERFCAEDHPGVVRERGTLQQMRERYGEAVIPPNAVMLFSEKQFAERDIWNAKGSRFNVVPIPLEDDHEIEWTPLWSISRKRRCFLPTQLLMMRGMESTPCVAIGCSNGNAAGNTFEEAVLQGFLELVERDAVAIWWYNRLNRPGVDLTGIGDSWITRMIQEYNSIGRHVWALDLTTDLGIATVAAVSRDRKGEADRLVMGLGCHLDPRIALQRAMAEMNQMFTCCDDLAGKDALDDPETLHWFRTATVENQPHMTPDRTVPLRQITELVNQYSGDLFKDIQHCCSCVEAQGLEVLVLDQMRELVGLPVVKVVVPGLRHFWARYAPGRLFDVPVRMGELSKPLKEDQLNPIPIFF